MNKLTCFLFAAITLSGYAQNTSDYKKFIEASEGKRLSVYVDPTGNKTIGIGHKLKNGENYKNINETICNELFAVDLEIAKRIAMKTFPSFDKQPKEVKLILVSLSYNMGAVGINKFVKFKQAIHLRNYKQAANELKDSKWFRQVGNRGTKYTAILSKRG